MKKMEEYCSTVEKLLEATAAMSLAVENKKLAPQTTTPASSEKTTHANKITNKQPTFSESSLEDSTRNKPPTRDRRKSYSQGQNSSLDSKSVHASNNQTPNKKRYAKPILSSLQITEKKRTCCPSKRTPIDTGLLKKEQSTTITADEHKKY